MKTKKLPLLIALLAGMSFALPGKGGIWKVKTKQKIVALTFDDGPNPPYTEKILAILKEKNIQATFFLIGMQIEAHPETAKRIQEAGHEIGGHSYDWETLAFKRKSVLNGKLDRMDLAFKSIGINHINLFRPPNGLLSFGQQKMIEKRALKIILADVIAWDWKSTNPNKIETIVLKKVHPGAIIVLHDGGGNRDATVAALPKIIDTLHQQGYQFLTISNLLSHH